MTKELDANVKIALDESRILILGAQVLFGFAKISRSPSSVHVNGFSLS